jgi:hypothetical protein
MDAEPLYMESPVEANNHSSDSDSGQSSKQGPSTQLEDTIKRLEQQIDILNNLIDRSATRKTSYELSILQKSKNALAQELSMLVFHRDQLQLEESDSVIMPGRFQVQIPSYSVQDDDSKKPFAIYVIEITKLDQKSEKGTGNINNGWIVARRYSEFHALHKKLKERFSFMNKYVFPKKSVINLFKISESLMEERKVILEKYLQDLSLNHDICKTPEFIAFMCQQHISMIHDMIPSGKKPNKLAALIKSGLGLNEAPTSPKGNHPTAKEIDPSIYQESIEGDEINESFESSNYEIISRFVLTLFQMKQNSIRSKAVHLFVPRTLEK